MFGLFDAWGDYVPAWKQETSCSHPPAEPVPPSKPYLVRIGDTTILNLALVQWAWWDKETMRSKVRLTTGDTWSFDLPFEEVAERLLL